uniref:Uncharacterized protein n=1 Tax=Romanomermis culicivorax TaxID=13658 RepID=A0A915KQ90_ROMCU
MIRINITIISSAEDPSFCDIFCNDVLYNFTFKPHLTRYSIIDQLQGIDLRSFLKISRPEELGDYCNSIFVPYLSCSNSCKLTERNISRLNSLTYICITKFKDISENLACLKWVDEASFQVCSKHFKSHKESFTKLDDALSGNETKESLLKLSSDYCPKLELLLHCEDLIYYDECGSVMAGVQRQLMLMILDDVNERLSVVVDHHEHLRSKKEICGEKTNNNNNIHLPEVCRRLYSEFLENSKNLAKSTNILEIISMVQLFLLVSVIFSL